MIASSGQSGSLMVFFNWILHNFPSMQVEPLVIYLNYGGYLFRRVCLYGPLEETCTPCNYAFERLPQMPYNACNRLKNLSASLGADQNSYQAGYSVTFQRPWFCEYSCWRFYCFTEPPPIRKFLASCLGLSRSKIKGRVSQEVLERILSWV